MENLVNPCPDFWKDKRVLVTGHTGFKGSWLVTWLKTLNADIMGVALEPASEKSLYIKADIGSICDSNYCDINNYKALSVLINEFKPEIVFHLAAQPLVLQSYKEPIDTFQTNVLGTGNVLQALRKSDHVKSIIVVTTDKVYENKEWIYPYREHDNLGGHDPYSASKACTELLVNSFRRSYFQHASVGLATVRAGNVIGGGDWSKNRLLPDAMTSWIANNPVIIRNPHSVRPWQHVLDPLCGYLLLAEKIFDNFNMSGAFNFGPFSENFGNVERVIEIAKNRFGNVDWSSDYDYAGPHEAQTLTLDSSKAISLLGYRPRWDLETGINKTVDWYKNEALSKNCADLCLNDISDYVVQHEKI